MTLEHAVSLVQRPEPVVDRTAVTPADPKPATPTKAGKPRVRRKAPAAGVERKSLRPKGPVVPDENPFDRRY